MEPAAFPQQIESAHFGCLLVDDQQSHRVPPVPQIAENLDRRRSPVETGGLIPLGGETSVELALERPRHPRVAADAEQKRPHLDIYRRT
jgi:hypothetical protein